MATIDYRAKKIWMGHVSVRDYIVKQAIEQKKDLRVKLGDTSKTFGWKDLINLKKNSAPVTFTSKYSGRAYKLIDLPWS